MIHQVKGDILFSGAQALAHGIAPNDHFATGLALSLREQWPALYKDFRHYCKTQHPKAGGIWVWASANGKRIVNLLTQAEARHEGDNPGRATLENVNHSLRELRKFITDEKIQSLALPRLATGVGGLAWSDVLPLIERHLGDATIPIYIYTTYQKGVHAGE